MAGIVKKVYYCSRCRDVISRGNQWCCRLMSALFSGYKNYCAKIRFIITKSNSKSLLVTYIVLYPQKELFKTQLESQNDNREKREKRENEVR